MSIVLVDTNIISFLFKGDTRAQDYAAILTGQRLAVSFMTVAELFEWTKVRRWGPSRVRQLEDAMTKYLVLPSDAQTCRYWGEIRARGRFQGKTVAPQDAWIAATALRHQLPLVTHNPSDFRDIHGLSVRSVLP